MQSGQLLVHGSGGRAGQTGDLPDVKLALGMEQQQREHLAPICCREKKGRRVRPCSFHGYDRSSNGYIMEASQKAVLEAGVGIEPAYTALQAAA